MRDLIYKHALKNAHDHGRASPKAVLGKVLAEKPEMKGRVRELLPLIDEVVEEVNSLPKEKIAQELEGHEFAKKEAKERGLPELPNAEKVVLRFAPNPSGPLHIGHSRAAILNDEYAKRYKGKLLLRIEDTDPRRVDAEASDMIREELEWLGVEWHSEVIQSERLGVYHEHAKKLLEMGAAYVCTCGQEEFKTLREAKRSCPCRELEVGENLGRFEAMFSRYREGEVVVRLKTDLEHGNPSVRDFPIMRIVEFEHPTVGKRGVYPLMNFSVPVDDHLLGVTHVLRGKDHILNTEKQEFIYGYFGWERPAFIHYGILKIGGVALSTSEIGRGIKRGEYSDWDDIRLGTIRALRRRGIRAEAIRRAMLDVGVKRVDISFSWENLYAHNREIIEPKAKRYFFVSEPKSMRIKDLPLLRTVEMRSHPDFDMGMRELEVAGKEQKEGIYVSGGDFANLKKGDAVRLMGAFNVTIKKKEKGTVFADFRSLDLEEAKRMGAKMVHWVPQKNVKVKVYSPEGTSSGLGEKGLEGAEVGDVVQFERFGFVRIDRKGDGIEAYLTHR